MDFANYTQFIDRQFGSLLGLGGGATDVLVALIILAIFAVLSRVATFLLEEIIPKFTARTKTTLDDELVKALQRPIQLFVFLTGFAVALHSLEIGTGYFDFFDKVIMIIYILLAAYFLSNIVHALIQWYQNDIAPRTESKLDDILMPFLDKIDRIIIFSLAFLMILDRLGYPITPVLASMGLAGIAVAFAAQETLSNVFGAFSIITDRPFKVGDRIAMSDTDIGDVIDIGVRSTRLMTMDNKIVIYPNAIISKGKIINYSEPDLKVRFTMKVSIGYKEDIERAQKLMTEIAKKTDGVISDPAPQAYVVSLSSYTIDMILHIWVTDYRLEFKVSDMIYREIIRKFAAEKIDIPYPITTILKEKK
ncbi:MAG: mechanosensitive ion channel family protein [Candidatus Methanoperedens sp.]|nr:mechanosensitive ion channel family protein [Candidatus Methanoperedens sp.]MCE8426446.1 mechanosensitive ion channel family protein [Candidatus Methanoperedens sp.]MCE8428563.1 mechanosensitive ion channel family protein [Candidatus Methanoperedens sp.]